MIDRAHDLPITRRAEVLNISRGSVDYLPRPMPEADLAIREGVPLSLSTLADGVGACSAVLSPLFERLPAHVLAAERLHGDDTTVPVLAKGKTDTGRSWVYVRDDRPFGGFDPPAALFYSRDRSGEHPRLQGQDRGQRATVPARPGARLPDPHPHYSDR